MSDITDADRKRLAAILGMLGSSSAGERDNAARQAEAFRRKHQLTWAELMAAGPNIESEAQPAPEPPPQPPPQAQAQPPDRRWTPVREFILPEALVACAVVVAVVIGLRFGIVILIGLSVGVGLLYFWLRGHWLARILMVPVVAATISTTVAWFLRAQHAELSGPGISIPMLLLLTWPQASLPTYYWRWVQFGYLPGAGWLKPFAASAAIIAGLTLVLLPFFPH